MVFFCFDKYTRYLECAYIYIYTYIYIYIYIYIFLYLYMCEVLFGIQVIERLSPAVAIYENVITVTQKSKDSKGIVQKPCVEALMGLAWI